MVTTLADEQVDADASNLKGDVTVVLLEGLFTTTPAKAGSDTTRASADARVTFRAKIIEFPLRLQMSALAPGCSFTWIPKGS
jgi:hypothetical protein